MYSHVHAPSSAPPWCQHSTAQHGTAAVCLRRGFCSSLQRTHACRRIAYKSRLIVSHRSSPSQNAQWKLGICDMWVLNCTVLFPAVCVLSWLQRFPWLRCACCTGETVLSLAVQPLPHRTCTRQRATQTNSNGNAHISQSVSSGECLVSSIAWRSAIVNSQELLPWPQ